MGMEKRGVVEGEGTPPNELEKDASTTKHCGAKQCCAPGTCGRDTLSKMAEEGVRKDCKKS